jgi:hypothetical protein
MFIFYHLKTSIHRRSELMSVSEITANIGVSSLFNGLLPEQIFAGSKTFFTKSKACFRRFENSSRLTAGLKQVQSAFLALR